MSAMHENVFLQAEDTHGGPTQYSGRFGAGKAGWLTGIANRALGPICLPKFGRDHYDIHNPATVLQVDSMQ